MVRYFLELNPFRQCVRELQSTGVPDLLPTQIQSVSNFPLYHDKGPSGSALYTMHQTPQATSDRHPLRGLGDSQARPQGNRLAPLFQSVHSYNVETGFALFLRVCHYK